MKRKNEHADTGDFPTDADLSLADLLPYDQEKVQQQVQEKQKKQAKVRSRSIKAIIKAIDKHYESDIERCPSHQELVEFQAFVEKNDIQGTEYFFCPEDMFYKTVLNTLQPNDVVWDIGAGDLRFDLMMSQKVKKVYAVEIYPLLLGSSLNIIGGMKPCNLVVICGDGFKEQLPEDVTVIVCLMIHRQHEFSPAMRKKKIIYAQTNGISIIHDNI